MPNFLDEREQDQRGTTTGTVTDTTSSNNTSRTRQVGYITSYGSMGNRVVTRELDNSSSNIESTPVYDKLPDLSTQMNYGVGKPDDKNPELLINFTCDVKFIQKKLKDLGLLSEADYASESVAPSSTKFTTTNYREASENSNAEANAQSQPMNESEKLFMAKYNKIPVGPQTESGKIPATIKAIEVFQREVRKSNVIDGRIDPGGKTLNLLLLSTKQSILLARKQYQEEIQRLEDEKRLKAAAAKKKQEEEQRQKAEAEKLTKEPTDESNVERIYNLYIYDMRVLGSEMRKYAKYNPTLVIKMLEHVGWSENDNLAYNITSNFSDGDLAALDKSLIKKLKEALDSGWKKDVEQFQITRLNTALTGSDMGIVKGKITQKDMENAAKEIGVEVAALMAIAKKETGPQGSFYKEGQATILFERHKMYSHLKTAGFDARALSQDSDIVNKNAGGYGKFSSQYGKLERAKAIDTASAIKSASWGKFQVMGENYKWGGYSSPQEMEKAVNLSELEQLKFFVGFIKNKASGSLIKALNDHDWEKVATLYNGSKWKEINPDYATKLETYYDDFKEQGF